MPLYTMTIPFHFQFQHPISYSILVIIETTQEILQSNQNAEPASDKMLTSGECHRLQNLNHVEAQLQETGLLACSSF